MPAARSDEAASARSRARAASWWSSDPGESGLGIPNVPLRKGTSTFVRHQSSSAALSSAESEKMMFSYSMRTPGSPSIAWICPGHTTTIDPATTGRRSKLSDTAPEPRFT